jgi:VWFA-related protein
VLLRSCSALRLVLLLGVSLLSAPLQSQTAPPEANGNRVFQTNARIVVLDVVVTGKNRRPLTGLQKQDFVLSEDGHPQTITYFEEHTGAQQLQVTPPDATPNIFTNFPRVKPSDSVTVLLFDSLNTPLDDQSFVREQMLKYLKKANPGHRIAIFTLGTQLRLLQSFTDDPTLLTAAINNRRNGAGPETSTLLQSSAETAATQETSQALMLYAPEAAESIRQFAAEQDSERGEVRLRLTLEALQELAHYLAAIPGRKNIAWFSGAFPVAIVPDPTLPQEFGVQRDNQEEVHKTDALLASAQVAIYPIAAEGVGVDSSSSAATDSRMTQPQLVPQATPQQISNPRNQDTQLRNANRATMDLIAKDTGGAAFYGTNSLTDALDSVTDHGSHFYTLTYTSTNPATDGRFRKIQVALAQPGYQLAYRRGYYADDAKTVQAAAAQPQPKPPVEPLSRFLRPGVPQSTQIPLTLRVTRGAAPPRAAPAAAGGHAPAGNPNQGGDNPNLTGALTRYSVDFMMPARSLQWDPAPDGHRRVSLEAALVVYDREGKAVNWILRQINLNPDAAHYTLAQTSGVNLFLEIDAPDSGVSLRGGIYDLNANLAGTLGIPLRAVVNSPTATSSK